MTRWAIICTDRVSRKNVENVDRNSKPSVAGSKSEEESFQQEKKNTHPQEFIHKTAGQRGLIAMPTAVALL